MMPEPPPFLHLAVDSPGDGEIYPAHRIPVMGWAAVSPGVRDAVEAVKVYCGDVCLGHTRQFYARPDVDAHLDLSPGSQFTGFCLHVSVPEELPVEPGGELSLSIAARLRSRPESWVMSERRIRLQALRAEELPYGFMLKPASQYLLHRDGIYGSGPSSEAVHHECLELLTRYLKPGSSVLDVGCGMGPYGPELLRRGYRWFGVEVKAEDCAELARRGLPHRQVAVGQPLPFAANAFDAAICLEVLEHIEDTHTFLGELARVTARRAIFSVPNVELIPLMSRDVAVPWHLLEGDHKNFFTRFSLRALLGEHFADVSVLDYGLHPLGASRGEAWPYHLLALAEKSSSRTS